MLEHNFLERRSFASVANAVAVVLGQRFALDEAQGFLTHSLDDLWQAWYAKAAHLVEAEGLAHWSMDVTDLVSSNKREELRYTSPSGSFIVTFLDTQGKQLLQLDFNSGQLPEVEDTEWEVARISIELNGHEDCERDFCMSSSEAVWTSDFMLKACPDALVLLWQIDAALDGVISAGLQRVSTAPIDVESELTVSIPRRQAEDILRSRSALIDWLGQAESFAYQHAGVDYLIESRRQADFDEWVVITTTTNLPITRRLLHFASLRHLAIEQAIASIQLLG